MSLVARRSPWAPVRHFAGRSAVGLLLIAGVGLGFGTLLLLVRAQWAPLAQLDRTVAGGLNGLVSPYPWLVDAITAASRLGGRPLMLWLVVLAVLLLVIRRSGRLALYLVVTGLGALVLDPTLKVLVGRLRPIVDVPIASAPGNSFPSGHALGSMVVYGALALVFLPAVPPRWRRLFLVVPALIVALVGFTRIALGVHFLSDVLAGWLLGIAWLGVTAYAFRLWRVEVGRTVPPLDEGLEPEAAPSIKPAPWHRGATHPWLQVTEILTGWVLVFGVLYVLGLAVRDLHDDGLNRWFQSFRTTSLDSLSHFWSKAGDTHTITLILLIACPLALAVWRQWRPVVFLLVTMAGELTLFLCTAAAVQRERPQVEQMDGQMPTSSFPSGHIAATMCVWAAIAVLVIGRARGWWRWLALAPAILMPLGVALSRVYRGMHHPTDVLGALVLTALWLGLLCWVLRPWVSKAPSSPAPLSPPAASPAESSPAHA